MLSPLDTMQKPNIRAYQFADLSSKANLTADSTKWNGSDGSKQSSKRVPVTFNPQVYQSRFTSDKTIESSAVRIPF